MSEQRTMTIARALTRMKNIKAQLNQITLKIGQFGAGSSLEKNPIVDTKISLSENQSKAHEELKSLFQQFKDLSNEVVKIKNAIDKANLETDIQFQVGEEMVVMKINDALTTKRYLQPLMGQLVQQYNRAVASAQQKVDKNNAKYSDLTEDQKKILLAEVAYYVSPDQVKFMDTFLIEFLTELDGTLNEVNAVTQIVVE